MAVNTVKVELSGQLYDAVLNSTTGKYQVSLNAPSGSSWNETNHKYGLKVTATDTAGNSITIDRNDSEFGSNLQLRVYERVKPIADITYPTNNALIINNKPTISGTVTDSSSGINISTIELLVNDVAVTPTTAATSNGYSFSYVPATALDDGVNTIKVKVSDNDGNVSVQDIVTFTIDTVPPTLNVSTPSNGLVTNNPSLTVTGTTNDAASSPVTVTIKLNSGSAINATVNSSGSFSHALSLVEGANTILIKSTDAAGKYTEITRTVTLDTHAPVIQSVTITPNELDGGESFIVEIEVSD